MHQPVERLMSKTKKSLSNVIDDLKESKMEANHNNNSNSSSKNNSSTSSPSESMHTTPRGGEPTGDQQQDMYYVFQRLMETTWQNMNTTTTQNETTDEELADETEEEGESNCVPSDLDDVREERKSSIESSPSNNSDRAQQFDNNDFQHHHQQQQQPPRLLAKLLGGEPGQRQQQQLDNLFTQLAGSNNNNNFVGLSPCQLGSISPPSMAMPVPAVNVPTTSRATKRVGKTNVYQGLYPIAEVKQYFKKETIDNETRYTCLWPTCNFATRKYSQHISRHIHLKHIGIKELKCCEPMCNKIFKRPESLVQHQKNHICGFGIDNERVRDPKNVCGAKNINRHFKRIRDNDIYIYQCQFGGCSFATSNSGSIRRHVHNQHVCPNSTSANNMADAGIGGEDEDEEEENGGNNNNNMNMALQLLQLHGQHQQQQQQAVNDGQLPFYPEVQLVESKEPYNPGSIEEEEDEDNKTHDEDGSSPSGSSMVISNNQTRDEEEEMDIDTNTSVTANAHRLQSSGSPTNGQASNNRSNGMYSLKNFKNHYRKDRGECGPLFVCLKCEADNSAEYTFKTQIALVRHLWDEIGFKDFECELCPLKFENEFSLYKHRKNQHTNVAPPPALVQGGGGGGNGTNMMMMINAEGGNDGANQQQQQQQRSPFIHNKNNQQQQQQQPAPPQQQPASMLPQSMADVLGGGQANALNGLGLPVRPAAAAANTAQQSELQFAQLGQQQQMLTMMQMLGQQMTPQMFNSLQQIYAMNMNQLAEQAAVLLQANNTGGGQQPATDTAYINTGRASPAESTSSSASLSSRVQPSGPPIANLSPARDNEAESDLHKLLKTPTNPNLHISDGHDRHQMLLAELQQQNFLPPQASTPVPSRMSMPQATTSLKQFRNFFDRQRTHNGDVYRCKLCQDYEVRTPVSMSKHLRNHHRQDIERATAVVTGAGGGLMYMAPTMHEQGPSRHYFGPIGGIEGVAPIVNGVGGDEEEDGDDEMIDVEHDQDGNNRPEVEEEESIVGVKPKRRSGHGIYSLKAYTNDYRREKVPSGSNLHDGMPSTSSGSGNQYHYRCTNCDQFTTTSQASMIRHIWQHKNKKTFQCRQCNECFDKEFSLYKHKKNNHPEQTSQNRIRASSSNKARLATPAAAGQMPVMPLAIGGGASASASSSHFPTHNFVQAYFPHHFPELMRPDLTNVSNQSLQNIDSLLIASNMVGAGQEQQSSSSTEQSSDGGDIDQPEGKRRKLPGQTVSRRNLHFKNKRMPAHFIDENEDEDEEQDTEKEE